MQKQLSRNSLVPPKPSTTFNKYKKSAKANILKSNTQALDEDDLEDLISDVQMMSKSNQNDSKQSKHMNNMSNLSLKSGSSSMKSKLSKIINNQGKTKNKITPVKSDKGKTF